MGTIANIGTRATGGRAGTWVIVPPGFEGDLPAGVERIDSPTDEVFVLGRVRAVDDADAAAAYAATEGLTLQPLSALTGAAPAPEAPPMDPPVGPAPTVGTEGAATFDELGDALAVDPPISEEARTALDRASSLGIGPGRHPGAAATGASRAVLEEAVARGLEAVDRTDAVGGEVVDGWAVNLTLGDPEVDRDLRQRAIVARHYWGPNVAAESVYPVARTAEDGEPLTGAKDYVIHLDGDDLPPVDAFWSYTVYGPDGFFSANPIDRYSLSGDTPGLERAEDGSIDIHLTHAQPASGPGSWLPTPDGPFQVIMRLYLPGEAVLDGTYRYPPIEVVDR